MKSVRFGRNDTLIGIIFAVWDIKRELLLDAGSRCNSVLCIISQDLPDQA